MPRAEFAYNSSVNRTTGKTPFEIVYGQIPRSPLDLTPLSTHHSRTSEDGIAFASYIRDMHHGIHERISSQNDKYKLSADLHRRSVCFDEGDLVMVRLGPERYSPRVATKLHARSAGPFPIVRKIGDNAYVLGIPAEWGINPTFNVSDLTPYRPMPPLYLPHKPSLSSPDDGRVDVNERSAPVPPLGNPKGHERIDEVLQEVIDSAGDKPRSRYLIRWHGRPSTEDSWLDEDELRRLRPDLFDSSEAIDSGPQLDGAEFSPPREDDGDHPTMKTRIQPTRGARVDQRDPNFKYSK